MPLVYIVNSGSDYTLPIINLQIIIMNSICLDHGCFYPDTKPACKISLKVGNHLEESKGTFLGLFYLQFGRLCSMYVFLSFSGKEGKISRLISVSAKNHIWVHPFICCECPTPQRGFPSVYSSSSHAGSSPVCLSAVLIREQREIWWRDDRELLAPLSDLHTSKYIFT